MIIMMMMISIIIIIITITIIIIMIIKMMMMMMVIMRMMMNMIMMMMMILLLLLLLLLIIIIIIIIIIMIMMMMMKMMMMMIIIIIIVIIIIVIELKGAIRDFLQSPYCAANCLQHARSSGPGAIVCKSCATHSACITCNMPWATWYKGTAQLLSLTDFRSHIFSFILLSEPLTNKGGEETGVPGENRWRRASENATY